MNINVVTVTSGWILQKIAERIVANSPEGVNMRVSHQPYWQANNFYVDIQNCYHGPTGGIDIGLFTHVHENDMIHVPTPWFELDHIVHMSKRSYDQWLNDPRCQRPNSMSFKMPGEIPNGWQARKPIIGVVQRGKYEGKGFFFLQELIKRPVAKNFKWMFVGNDWDEVASELSKVTEVKTIADSQLLWPDGYAKVYSVIDYLLIPSKWEGGPMSIIEAAAAGVPIIAADVGWVGIEIPVLFKFPPGDVSALSKFMEWLTAPQVKAREIVEELSYKDFSQHIVDVFSRISKVKKCTN